ncbi:hypothetical protein EVAR_80125_1 [Eumeta japonica]|uniref:Uncharacterized protein n=1 Tax=Eumeta variegata TaxID=151549 RepID=A0A4C1UE68_EUMVA|nr:hypothetical protein EVAR_80125_1 [Eumeta japonica]
MLTYISSNKLYTNGDNYVIWYSSLGVGGEKPQDVRFESGHDREILLLNVHLERANYFGALSRRSTDGGMSAVSLSKAVELFKRRKELRSNRRSRQKNAHKINSSHGILTDHLPLLIAKSQQFLPLPPGRSNETRRPEIGRELKQEALHIKRKSRFIIIFKRIAEIRRAAGRAARRPPEMYGVVRVTLCFVCERIAGEVVLEIECSDNSLTLFPTLNSVIVSLLGYNIITIFMVGVLLPGSSRKELISFSKVGNRLVTVLELQVAMGGSGCLLMLMTSDAPLPLKSLKSPVFL